MLTKRGVVISQPIKMFSSQSVKIGGGVPADDLRKYLLYFDELDFPNNNHISTGVGQDAEFLIKQGIAKRTMIQHPGTFSAKGNVQPVQEACLKAQQLAFEQNNKAEPGKWSLAQLSTSFYLPDAELTNGVEFELYNMLPVPGADVPLLDIIEFKEKRRDELITLRLYLDEMYQSIQNSADIPRAKNTNLIKLEQALKTIDRTLSESKIKKTLNSLRGYAANNTDSVVGYASLGAGIASSIEMDPIDAASIGALIGFAIKRLLRPKIQCHTSSIIYLDSIKREWPNEN